MKILHFGAQGVTAVRMLKQWSTHRHELVSSDGEGFNASNISADFVAALAQEADILQFHEPMDYVHDVDWLNFPAGKRKIYSASRSLLKPDGGWKLPDDAQMPPVAFDAYFGAHLGMRDIYGPSLEYAPEFVPVHDWLLQPGDENKQPVFFSHGGIRRQRELRKAGIELEIDWKTPDSALAARSRYMGVLDNYWTGFFSAFGFASMAQSLPVVVHVNERNEECLKILKAKEPPPFLQCEYAGGDLEKVFHRILSMPVDERLGIARFGQYWTRKYYDPECIAWRWDELYDALNGKSV